MLLCGQTYCFRDMSAVVEQPVTLTDQELHDLTGSPYPVYQIKWLQSRQPPWVFELSNKNKPKVGRYYANMRLAGQAAADKPFEADALPHFKNVR